MKKIWLTWNNIQEDNISHEIIWNNNPFTWEEVALLKEIMKFTDPTLFSPGLTKGESSKDFIKKIEKKLPKEKVDLFVKVVCRINNIDYEERKIKAKNKPIISINEIEKTFNKFHEIKVNIKKI